MNSRDSNSLVGRSLFTRGCVRVGAGQTITNLNGYGILVAEDAVIGANFDTGDPSFHAPASGESWAAGFYWPGKVKNITLTSGVIYIGIDK